MRDGDERLREDTLATEEIWRGHFVDLRRDTVRLPDGSTATREYLVHPGAVVVVPVLPDGRLVLERQWRTPMRRVMLEFPAGKLEPGEDPLACGMRELTEETGYTAAEWARAGTMNNAIAYSTETIHVWFARGLTRGERSLDAGEHLEVVEYSADELDAFAANGTITDAKSLTCLLWLQNWRAGRWPLVWAPAPTA